MLVSTQESARTKQRPTQSEPAQQPRRSPGLLLVRNLKNLASMAGMTRLLWRFFQSCALAFVAVSVLYTTHTLFISPLGSLVSTSIRSVSEYPWGLSAARNQEISGWRGPQLARPKPAYPVRTEAEKAYRSAVAPNFGWTSSNFVRRHGLGYPGVVNVDEQTILSKAFSNSMRPSNVMPYFYRATGSFKAEYITITTLITRNRFEVFARLVEKYQGSVFITLAMSSSSRTS